MGLDKTEITDLKNFLKICILLQKLGGHKDVGEVGHGTVPKWKIWMPLRTDLSEEKAIWKIWV